ncbi:hypothetical protein CYMTET_30312 [Cymbomonas tetramitiformis]|uniref:Rhodanese domain-containing protein n=1 Tax=Cymbomonas tetramitiformis TaxID=36881 RepID=A0AAE0FJ44_9CHLO|nr:hypothetical protein CYMTET_30312 [Cymbomonas tetramitiformis]
MESTEENGSVTQASFSTKGAAIAAAAAITYPSEARAEGVGYSWNQLVQESFPDKLGEASSAASATVDDAVEAVAETTVAVAESVGEAVEEAADAVTDMSADIASKVESVFSSVTEVVEEVAERVVEVPEVAASAPAQPASAASATVDDAVEAVAETTVAVAESVGEAVEEAADAVADMSADIASKVESVFSSVTEVVEEVAERVVEVPEVAASAPAQPASGAVSVATEAVADVVGSASEALSEALGDATDRVSEATAALTSTLDSVSGGVEGGMEALNIDFNIENNAAVSSFQVAIAERLESLDGILPPEGMELLQSATQDAELAAALGVLLVTLPLGALFALNNAINGGFSGVIKPAEVFNALQEDNALLVDTRSEDDRAANGIPELKRKARGKGIAIQIEEVGGATRRELKNPREVDVKVAALKVAAMCNSGATVYVMDGAGASKELARAVAATGRRACVVDNGFRGWVNAELAVEESTFYEASIVNLVQDEVESLSDSIASTVETTIDVFKNEPAEAAKLTVQAAGTAFALYYWRYSLQYIGLWGMGLSTYLWVTSYNTPGEWLNDTVSKAAKAADSVSKIEIPSLPAGTSLPALPGSSSSSPALPHSSSSSPALPEEEEMNEEDVVEEEEMNEEDVCARGDE